MSWRASDPKVAGRAEAKLQIDVASTVVTDDAIATQSVTDATTISSVSLPSTGPPQLTQMPSISDIHHSIRDPVFLKWFRARLGFVADRVDSERLRLSQSMNNLDLSASAVQKHWNRLQRKIESESFLIAHTCQWKLGVAHEVRFCSLCNILHDAYLVVFYTLRVRIQLVDELY